MARSRLSRPDPGLGFDRKNLNTFERVPPSLGSSPPPFCGTKRLFRDEEPAQYPDLNEIHDSGIGG